MLKLCVILLALSICLSIVQANSIANTIAGLGILGSRAVQSDQDVAAITLLNGVTDEPQIANDIQLLTAGAEEITFATQGIVPVAANDSNTNANMISSFGSTVQSLVRFFTDLQDKEPDLNELGQGSAIETALGDFKGAFLALIVALQALVLDPGTQGGIAREGAIAIAAIDDAAQEYFPPAA